METAILRRPRLRKSARVEVNADHAVVTGPAGTHVLRFPAEGRPAMARLFDALGGGGVDRDNLVDRHPEIEALPGLLDRLDSLHLLTETGFVLPQGLISGAQLEREARRAARRLQRRLARSRFRDALATGTATRRQMIGYALEYYWLVRAAPGLIAPALATAADLRMRAALQHFLASELNHDHYLAKALRAAGVDADLTHVQPLPSTFRIWQQHPLSFQAVLFLFEQPQPAFVEAFEARCRQLDLPPAFYLPLREHSGINEDADHGAISTELLGLVAAVDPEERVVVLRHVAVMVESMLQQEDEILDYYGDVARRCPRLFD